MSSSPHPLYLDVPLPYTRDLPVLGVAVTFRSNDPDLLSAVTEPFTEWSRYDGPVASTADPVRVDLVRHDVSGADGEGPLVYRLPDRERVVMVGPDGSVGIADGLRRQIVAYAGKGATSGFARGLVLSLLVHEDRFPVHASAVARGDSALLLLAPSETGKTTVSYAFARAGGDVLSDDSVFVQEGGAGGVWGAPGGLHLLPAAAAFFPELEGREAALQANGKRKIRVVLPAAMPGRFVYRRFGLCFLRRNGARTEPELRSLDTGGLEDELDRRPQERLDAFADEANHVLWTLAARRPAWVLELGGPPQSAVSCLNAALDVVEDGAAR